MSCTILDAAPMALYSVPGCSQVLHKASERRVPHSPAMAAVGSVLSLVVTELFPGYVLKLCKAYLCKPCVRTLEKGIRD